MNSQQQVGNRPAPNKRKGTEMGNIDKPLIDRLIHLSKVNSYNYYDRFNWPDTLEPTQLWCDEDLLTTYGTEMHNLLTDQQRFELSKWEAVNFFSLNVHGIKGALAFVSQSIYETRYEDISEYLHIFLAEENAHMWFFANFCLRYAGKIYRHFELKTDPVQNKLERDLYMFASTLIFEEFVDFYNHKVGKNEQVPQIVKEINMQHHIDESRHVAFGRDVVKKLFDEIVEEDETGAVRTRVSETIKKIFMYFVGLMYNPQAYSDAGIVAYAGFPNAAALRNHLRNSPARKEFHYLWFKRATEFFIKCGAIDDNAFLKA
jgi:hypothetical protein